MLFKDQNHKNFYINSLNKAQKLGDPYYESLFYILGLTETTKKHIDSIYDFDEDLIQPETVFRQPWQTSTSLRAVRMAYNLFNGFNGIICEEMYDDPEKYTPSNLFCCELGGYFYEALTIRYPEYCKEKEQI